MPYVHGFIFVFDLMDRASFDTLGPLITKTKESCKTPNPTLMIAANKLDLFDTTGNFRQNSFVREVEMVILGNFMENQWTVIIKKSLSSI